MLNILTSILCWTTVGGKDVDPNLVSETASECLKQNVAGYFHCCLNNKQFFILLCFVVIFSLRCGRIVFSFAILPKEVIWEIV